MSFLNRRLLASSKFLTQPLVKRRHMSGFSFAGPRNLNEIMKTDLLHDKKKAEISDIWMTYHENKERVCSSIISGDKGVKILERAATS